MYKLIRDIFSGKVSSVHRLFDNAFIPFDPANTDYAKFKLDITNGIELQDADGNVMSPQQVQDFLATLPAEGALNG